MDNLIGIEDEIYYQEQREKGNDGYDFSQPESTAMHSADSTPDDVDMDGLRTLKIGSRTTTFRIDGRSVTFREFRLAAKKKGVDMEKRLKLDNKPERFVSRGEVRVEQ